MKVLADFTLIPLGTGVSLSPYVAACENVFLESKVVFHLHANGTNLEGEWDEVMAAIKRCHEVVHSMGAVRISSLLKLGTRTDREQSLDDKIQSVQRKRSKYVNHLNSRS